MTFDSWDVGIHPETYLAHHGIKGMKHGRNRYQTESGEWTEEGLERRRKREGFGESRKERKVAKALAKAERHEARRQARSEAMAAYAEKRRQKNIKNLTDDELQAKIKRAKMEQEYKEAVKSPLIKTGAELVTKILEYKSNKEKRAIDIARNNLEMERLKTQQVQAKEAARKSYNDRKTARSEYKKMKQDVKGGLDKKREKELLGVKLAYRNTTIRGGIGKRINQFLTAGKSEQYQAKRKAKGETKANRIKANAERKADAIETLEQKDRKARKKLGL